MKKQEQLEAEQKAEYLKQMELKKKKEEEEKAVKIKEASKLPSKSSSQLSDPKFLDSASQKKDTVPVI